MAHTDQHVGNAIIYKNISDDAKINYGQEVTTGLWTGDTGSLSTFNTSDTQIAKANAGYFIDVYDTDPDAVSTAEVQFSLGYGHLTGGGSPTLTQQDTSTLASKAVYLGMKNLLLGPDATKFTWEGAGGVAGSDQIYAIVISRARYKGYIDPGNWQLTLSGSNGTFTFIDDSSQTLGSRKSFATSGVVFKVVSGSLSGTDGSTIHATLGETFTGGSITAATGYGYFYPQKGIIILNPNVIDPHVGMKARTGSLGHVVGNNTAGDHIAPSGVHSQGENTASAAVYISASLAPATFPQAAITGALGGAGGSYKEQYNWAGLLRSMILGADFQARAGEIISSTHYFLRLRNSEFNYSNNPTFATKGPDAEQRGQLVHEDFDRQPKVFVTTVGMYNEFNELLAVAKLSRPLEKSFDKEALLRVRLDF